MSLEIRIEYPSVAPSTLVETLCRELSDGWSRDGILEHQVSTREEVQYCFRREDTEEIPRCALCLAGPTEVLTVAAVVPIDRGVELSDEQRASVVAEFYHEVVDPVADHLEIDVELRESEEPTESESSEVPSE